jgi:hypothetical protein
MQFLHILKKWASNKNRGIGAIEELIQRGKLSPTH